MDVDVLAFTGSTEVAYSALLRRIQHEAGLAGGGGKSPNIVLADAPNLDTPPAATLGIWFNQGEVCTAGSRPIVEDKIKDASSRRSWRSARR
jgi:acyl-CoA reductase-like NAD-dependent aldehyde dehydrogenase